MTDITNILVKLYMFRKQVNLEGLEEVHAFHVLAGHTTQHLFSQNLACMYVFFF